MQPSLEETLVTSETEDVTVNGKPAGNIKIYKASFCAAVIRHYDRSGNEIAQYSLDQFAEIGLNVWIQSMYCGDVYRKDWVNHLPT